MKKLMKFIDNYIIYILIFLSFLFYCQITENTKIITIILWPTMFLSLVNIIYKCKKNYKVIYNNKIFICMNLFLLSYAISMLINYKYGIYSNLRTLFYMIIMFYIVYLQFIDKTKEERQRLLNNICIEFFSISTILSLASLIIIPMKFTVFNILGTPIALEGIAWGRLSGFYTDYNYGGLIVANAIFLGIYIINQKENNNRKYKILIYLGIIINIIYIYFTDSRGTMLSIIISVIAISFFNGKIKKENKKQIAKRLLMTLIICSLIISGKYIVKKSYSLIFEQKYLTKNDINSSNINNEAVAENEVSITNIKREDKQDDSYTIKEIDINSEVNQNLILDSKSYSVLNRNDGSDKDISNRRFDLWKSGIEIFKSKPIFGVGFENIVGYAKENLPNTYLINNDFTVFYNFHNIIFNVMAGQGIIGLIILIILIILVLLSVWKNIGNFNTKSILLIGIVTNGLVEGCNLIGDIIYFFSPNSIIFWIIVGLFFQNSKKEDEI